MPPALALQVGPQGTLGGGGVFALQRSLGAPGHLVSFLSFPKVNLEEADH